jgi:serine/threonine protein kinase
VPHEAAGPKRELNPDQWRQIGDLLATAIQLPIQDRPAYVASVCQGNDELRAELESLIAAHEIAEAGEFEQGILDTSPREQSSTHVSLVGKHVGAYRIEAEIAHGGMGRVYRATRADERFSKEVAIKVLDQGTVSERSLEMFRHERKILANLEHPNIARLLDAGESEDGAPYFVMEYVDGESIDVYCNAQRLTIEERLSLFLKVCSAVQYAHQNLVVHRDIKPLNILVTQSGDPKLLDFGIAKVADANDPSVTVTATAWRAMTPAYASPEQLLGKPLTIATDIYSLGLVLYELLAGRYAYGARTSALDLQRAILEQDPQRPSAAIFRVPVAQDDKCATAEEISEARQLTPQKLCSALRGDLESVVLKAVRKEPHARYASVERLSEDIERYLEGLPVMARQGTLMYRTQKFVTRHRAAVVMAGVACLLLIGGIVAVLREAHIARLQEARAERRFNDVRKLANSLIFQVHDSIRKLPGSTAARKLILEQAQEYLDGLAKESASDPSLLRELAAAYMRLAEVLGDSRDANIGDTAGALKNFKKSVELRETVVKLEPKVPERRRELAETYMALSRALSDAGRHDESGQYLRRALQILEPLASAYPQNNQMQQALGRAYQSSGSDERNTNLNELKKFHEKALAIFERLAQLDPGNRDYKSEVAFAHKHVASILDLQKQFQEALEHERAALKIEEALLAENPQDTYSRYAITFTYDDTGYALRHLGQLDAALGYYRRALAIRSALADADPQDTKSRQGVATIYSFIGDVLWDKQDLKGAAEAYRQALKIREGLSARNPANDFSRRRMEESETSLAMTYAKMTVHGPHRSAEEKRVLCSQARSLFLKSLPGLQSRKAKGLGTKEDVAFLDEATQAFDRCNRTLAQPGPPRGGVSK